MKPADVGNIIYHSRHNGSSLPVTTARYLVEFVMNEDNPNGSNEDHIAAFAMAVQDTLDATMFTADLRYDAINFHVLCREVLDIAPANELESTA